MPTDLDPKALVLLKLLLRILPHVDPDDPGTFITYTEAHKQIGLKILFGHAGRSLQAQGLDSLAEWAKNRRVPAITGLFIRELEQDPGPGYFKFYGKREVEDLWWWLEEIRKAKTFDWVTYLGVSVKNGRPRAATTKPPAGSIPPSVAKLAQDDSRGFDQRSDEQKMLDEAKRIANLIFARVTLSGSALEYTAPERGAPDDLVLNICELLRASPLVCYLCSGLMQIRPQNRLLQPSPDRVDSRIKDYGPQNLKLAHPACNLGKSAASVEEYQEWVQILRGY